MYAVIYRWEFLAFNLAIESTVLALSRSSYYSNSNMGYGYTVEPLHSGHPSVLISGVNLYYTNITHTQPFFFTRHMARYIHDRQ